MSDDIQEQDNESSLAIIGMTCHFPKAESLDEYWEIIHQGGSGIQSFNREQLLQEHNASSIVDDPDYVPSRGKINNPEMFDADFFGVSPMEAKMLDPQQRLFLMSAWRALENAGYDSEQYEGDIGVFASSGISMYLLQSLKENNNPLNDSLEMLIANDKDFVATRVSYKLNLSGPSATIQTACSSSLSAVHFACQSLLNYECDIALAGGVRVAVPTNQGYTFQQEGILSPDGKCRPFDKDAAGTVPGDGAGLVVIKRLDDAINDGDHIEAVIRATALNNDGSNKMSYTAPSVSAQSEVMETALRVAGIDAEEVGYIETHGTGTKLGDSVESAALSEVYGNNHHCAIGSVKANIGHLDAAAGIAALIKTTLVLKNKKIPPLVNFREVSPELNLPANAFSFPTKASDWIGNKRIAAVSSLGVGGTNVHLILEEWPEPEYIDQPQAATQPELLMFSARSQSELHTYLNHYAAFFSQNHLPDLADIAHTLSVGRKHFPTRKSIVVSNVQDGLAQLQTLITDNLPNPLNTKKTSWVFSGLKQPTVNALVTGTAIEGYLSELADQTTYSVVAKCLYQYSWAVSLLNAQSDSLLIKGLDMAGEIIAACALGMMNLNEGLGRILGTTITISLDKLDKYHGDHLGSIHFDSQFCDSFLCNDESSIKTWLANLTGSADKPSASLSSSHYVIGSSPVNTNEYQAFNRDKLLSVMGQLWESGNAIQGDYFNNGKRCELPTYPFKLERYWLPDESQARSHPVNSIGTDNSRLPINDWINIPSWHRFQALKHLSNEKKDLQKKVLVFEFEGGTLSQELSRFGYDVIQCRPGKTTIFEENILTIDPTKDEHYNLLLSELNSRAFDITDIVYAWSLVNDETIADDLLKKGFLPLLRMVKSMFDLFSKKAIHLRVLTNHAFSINGLEKTYPELGMLQGAVQSFPLELPLLRCYMLDIDSVTPLSHVAESVLSANLAPVQAIRFGHIWLPEIIKHPVNSRQLTLREKGVYLITGGTGTLGLNLAEKLIARYSATVILLSRTVDGIDDIASRNTESAEYCEKIKSLLSQYGGNILFQKTDVTSLSQMEETVASIEKQYGGIHGVIHAASLPGAGVSSFVNVDDVENKMAPKIQGAQHLISIFKNKAPDFMLLCSSVTALVGGVAHVTYASANAYLDHFAEKYNSEVAFPVISVNWSGWRDLSLSAREKSNAAFEKVQAEMLASGINAEEGFSILEDIVGYFGHHHLPRVTVLIEPIESFKAKSSSSILYDTDTENDEENNNSSVDLTDQIVQIMASGLGVEQLDAETDIFTVGADSIIAIRMLSTLKKKIGIKVGVHELFKNPSAKQLAEHLEGKDKPAEASKPKAKLERVDLSVDDLLNADDDQLESMLN